MGTETITSLSVVAKDDYKPEIVEIDKTKPVITFCSYNIMRWR